MGEKPRAFVGDAEHTVHLMGADALFGRTEKVDSVQPSIEWNLGSLHHSSHRDRKLFPTGVAEP